MDEHEKFSAGERRLIEMIEALERKLKLELEKLMSADDELNAAVAALGTVITNAVAALQAWAAPLAAHDDPVVVAAAASLTQLAANLAAAIVVPPAAAPAPQPAPTPAPTPAA